MSLQTICHTDNKERIHVGNLQTKKIVDILNQDLPFLISL